MAWHLKNTSGGSFFASWGTFFQSLLHFLPHFLPCKHSIPLLFMLDHGKWSFCLRHITLDSMEAFGVCLWTTASAVSVHSYIELFVGTCCSAVAVLAAELVRVIASELVVDLYCYFRGCLFRLFQPKYPCSGLGFSWFFCSCQCRLVLSFIFKNQCSHLISQLLSLFLKTL